MVPKEDLAPLVQDGTLSRFALISRYEDKNQLFLSMEAPAKEIPVLHNKLKSSGELNFNEFRYYFQNWRPDPIRATDVLLAGIGEPVP